MPKETLGHDTDESRQISRLPLDKNVLYARWMELYLGPIHHKRGELISQRQAIVKALQKKLHDKKAAWKQWEPSFLNSEVRLLGEKLSFLANNTKLPGNTEAERTENFRLKAQEIVVQFLAKLKPYEQTLQPLIEMAEQLLRETEGYASYVPDESENRAVASAIPHESGLTASLENQGEIETEVTGVRKDISQAQERKPMPEFITIQDFKKIINLAEAFKKPHFQFILDKTYQEVAATMTVSLDRQAVENELLVMINKGLEQKLPELFRSEAEPALIKDVLVFFANDDFVDFLVDKYLPTDLKTIKVKYNILSGTALAKLVYKYCRIVFLEIACFFIEQSGEMSEEDKVKAVMVLESELAIKPETALSLAQEQDEVPDEEILFDTKTLVAMFQEEFARVKFTRERGLKVGIETSPEDLLKSGRCFHVGNKCLDNVAAQFERIIKGRNDKGVVPVSNILKILNCLAKNTLRSQLIHKNKKYFASPDSKMSGFIDGIMTLVSLVIQRVKERIEAETGHVFVDS